MEAEITKNLTRADVVRLLSRRILEDREVEMAGAADAVSKARDAFHHELKARAFRVLAPAMGRVVEQSGGDLGRVEAVADYELYDDELDKPRSTVFVTMRDGNAHDCTVSARMPVLLTSRLLELRDEWISAVHRANAAVIASRKMSEVEADVRIQVIQEALESTEAGRKVLALLPDVRAEAGRKLCE